MSNEVKKRNFGLRIGDWKEEIADCELQIANWELQISDCGLENIEK